MYYVLPPGLGQVTVRLKLRYCNENYDIHLPGLWLLETLLLVTILCMFLITQIIKKTLFIRRNKLYWTDDTNNRLYRANLDGSDSSVILSTDLSCPGGFLQCSFTLILVFSSDGLAWDWINQKLYWTDYCKDTIEVYDPVTGNRRVLLDTGSTSNNKDIVVDPTTG